MFSGVFSESIIKRAIERGLLQVELVNFRDFTDDRHHTVDDAPFGGGAGMLLKPDPLFRAVESLQQASSAADADDGDVAERAPAVGEDAAGHQTVGGHAPGGKLSDRVILLSPQGRPFTQAVAAELVACGQRLVLICGHYEGFDERVRTHLATDEISLGDFVMTGGEIAAMAMVDTMVRLVPGVLGNESSAHDDSFAHGLLEYPQYTRPAVYRGLPVPPVLLSGNHQEVARWRRMHSLYRTWQRRPDLLARRKLSDEERQWVRRWTSGDLSGIDVP
ncbi:tRNA (guanosine(37)-N1)-methyltransferase TrmD [Alicyclobacillus cycloheptanicus]|nr:tRNA (guanosine(37)-N1)-methyltransferase TrmD [Alicyclobacillus cycloheptanicus]